MSKPPVQFESDVRPMSLEAYQEARHTFIRSAANALPLVSVYEFGTVSAPGVSDLDFILVVDESLLEPRRRREALWSDDYLMDWPIVFSESQFEKLPYLLHTGALELVWGTEADVAPLAGDHEAILNAAKLADFGHFLLHALIKLRAHDTVSARSCLLRLRSVAHSVWLGQKMGLPMAVRMKRFVEDVRRVRSGWLERQNYAELGRLLEAAPVTLLTLMDSLQHIAKSKGWWRGFTRRPEAITVQTGESSFSIFDVDVPAAWDEERCTTLAGPRLRVRGGQLDFSISAASFGPYLGAHMLLALKAAGWVDPVELSSSTRSNVVLSSAYARVVAERMECGREHIDWLRRNGLLRIGQIPPYGGVFQRRYGRRSVRSTLRRLSARGYSAVARSYFRRAQLGNRDCLVTRPAA